jgi:hypothetical protein
VCPVVDVVLPVCCPRSLGAFRTRIEEELLAIALIEEEGARLRQKALAEERLRREVEEIAGAMASRRWPKLIFGTICGLGAAGATAAAAATGWAPFALAVPGLVKGAYEAIRDFPRRDIPNSPLAFAALTRTRLSG